MISKPSREAARIKRHYRIRNKVNGTAQQPRLAVFRSNKHIYAQIIDDVAGNTLVAASTLEADIASKVEHTSTVEAAKAAGWDKVQAIAISGVQGDGTATARLTGYEKGVTEAGGEFLKDEIQYADAVADKAATSMEAIMQNHPEGVAIIVCNNDDMAMAAARAAKGNAAYAKTIFVGFDGIQSACNAILAGEETMSVAQEAYDMGYKAVEAAVKALEGEQVDSFIDSGSKVVDSTNCDEYIDDMKAKGLWE